MHIILRHMPFGDRYLILPADVPDEIANPRRHLALQRRPSIFRDPHQMEADFEHCVRARRYSALPEVYPARTR